MTYPARLDIPLVAGETKTLSLRWREAGVPLDLGGWSAVLQVRRAPDAPLLLEVNSLAGTISLPGDGLIVAGFNAAATSALPRRARYDLRVSSPGEARVVYLVEGLVTVRAPITEVAQ